MSGKAKHILKTTAKVIFYFFIAIISLFALAWAALQFPQTQTYVVGKATKWLSDKTKTTIAIRRVDIEFFKTIVLEGVYVEDLKKDTLLFTDQLKVNIGVLGLSNKEIIVNLIELDDAIVNLSKAKGEEKFNYEFLVDAFASDTTTTDTTTSAWVFDLEKVAVNKVRFNYADGNSGNDLHLALQNFTTNIETLGLEEKHPRINSLILEGLNVAFTQPAPEADTLGKAVAQVTKVDTISAAIEKSATGNSSVTAKEDSVFNDSGFSLTIGEIRLADATIKYDIKNTARKEKEFDYQHLAFTNFNLDLNKIEVGANNFSTQLANLAFQEQSGFELKKLALDVKANLPFAEVNLRTARTANSALDNILIQIKSIKDTKNMLNNLHVKADFEEDSLDTRDALFFTQALNSTPALKGQKLFVDGQLDLNGTNLVFDDFRLAINDQNYLQGTVSAQQITNLKQTEINLQLEALKTNIAFIKQFLPAGALPAQLNSLGFISVNGTLVGKLSEAYAKLVLASSGLGNVHTDLRLSTNETFDRNSVRGTIHSDNLNVGKILGPGSGLGKVGFVLVADGSQVKNTIAVKNANLLVKNLTYNQYTYRNLRVQGSYLDDKAKAQVKYNDANLDLKAKVSANMRGKQPRVDLNAILGKAHLRNLHLMTDTLQVGTTISASVIGFDPNTLSANLQLTDLKVSKPNKEVKLDSLTLVAGYQGNARSIVLNSDIIKANVIGQYTVEGLPIALELFIKEYFSKYHVSNRTLASQQRFDYSLYVKENPEILQVLVADLRIPEPISIKGSFDSQDSRLVMNGDAPQILYGDMQITDLGMNVSTNERKLSVQVSADKFQLSPGNVIPKPQIKGSFKKDDASFNLRLADDDADSRLNLNGRMTYRQDTFRLSLLPSEVVVKKEQWNITENASFTYAPTYIWIDDFVLQQKEQQIIINSQRITANNTLIRTELRKLKIGELIALIQPLDYQLGGELNGKAEVSDIFGQPTVKADVDLANFAVNENRIGNISLDAAKAAGSDELSMSASVLGPDNTINLEGRYNTVQTENNIDATVKIDRIKLEQFTVFAKQYVSELAGQLQADIRIQGSTSQPAVNGKILFANTVINAVANNVPYTLNNQSIGFENNQVVFNDFTIKDSYDRTAVLSGQINYADLDKIAVDMKFNTSSFLFMNTGGGYREPIFGKVLASADVAVTGPISNLVVDGDIRILDETQLSVPLSDQASEIQRAKYIHFVGDTLYNATAPEPEATEISGFALKARIRVSPEAVMKIIIDEKSGDILECSGRADLQLVMPPQGGFNLAGSYALEKGQYQMSLFGLVKKSFAIEKGSTINWNGPPTEAQVDITAIYETKAARYDLIQGEVDAMNDPTATQQSKSLVPVYVYLKMQGELLSPTISFDLNLPESKNSRIDEMVKDRLAALKNDESELNKQVFGLIALNRFIFDNAASEGGGLSSSAFEKVGQSVSRILTNQLNSLSQDYLGGVEINVDLQSTDQRGNYGSGLNDKQLAVNLSKTLLNDRLTVSVGSNVDLGAGGGSATSANPSSLQNVVGDFVVEYKLLQSGKLNLRFFRKVDPYAFSTTNREQIGASIIHGKRFNSFRDLFRKREKRKKSKVTE